MVQRVPAASVRDDSSHAARLVEVAEREIATTRETMVFELPHGLAA